MRRWRCIDEIVARPYEVMRHTRFMHRDEPRAFSVARPESFQRHREETRIAPAPRRAAEFPDRQQRFSRPDMESRRAPETGLRSRPESNLPVERPQQQTVQIAPLQERQTLDIRREPPQVRSESREPRHQERSFRSEDSSREARREAVRQAPDMRIEPPRPVAQPVNPPASLDRPRDELSRSPEPRHGMRLETRQVPREERAQPPRTERQENREAQGERRNERRERGQSERDATKRF